MDFKYCKFDNANTPAEVVDTPSTQALHKLGLALGFILEILCLAAWMQKYL